MAAAAARGRRRFRGAVLLLLLAPTKTQPASGGLTAMSWLGKLGLGGLGGSPRASEASAALAQGPDEDQPAPGNENVIHGSDSVENGREEIALWFPEGLAEWQSNQHPWIYEA